MVPSGDLYGFATKPAVSGKSLYYTYDGAQEYLETPHHVDFNFGNGVTDVPFSVGSWIYQTNAGGANGSGVVAKWFDQILGEQNEWKLLLALGKVQLQLCRGVTNEGVYCRYNTAVTLNQWYFILATYDGRGGTQAYNGIKIFLNGVRKDDTRGATGGAYVAMQPFTKAVNVGCNYGIGGIPADFFAGRITLPFVVGRILTESDVSHLYAISKELMGV